MPKSGGLFYKVAIGATALLSFTANPKFLRTREPMVSARSENSHSKSVSKIKNGDYSCSRGNITLRPAQLRSLIGIEVYSTLPEQLIFNVAETKGGLNVDIKGHGAGLYKKVGHRNFSDFVQMGDEGTINSSILFNQNSTMIWKAKITSLNGSANMTITYNCTYIGKHKDDTIRAVFIRPCEGDFYNPNAFSNKDPAGQTAVGGGTLDKVCKDLKDSGVTDVFLPFKVDDETNSHCGKSGELLYDSTTYKEYVNPRFRAAFEKGFDPIKALINACRGINFHAWFPVFNDREAAQIAGQKTNGIFSPAYESKIFADPANPTVVIYNLNLLAEIAEKYPVVGINLDYVRYAGSKEGDIPEGYRVQINPGTIEDFVKKVKDKFPNLKLSADVMAGEPRRTELGQNGILPYLDVIMPMAYGTGEAEQYVPIIRRSYPNATLIPDLRGWAVTQSSEGLIYDLKTDIAAVKSNGAKGYAIFTYEALLTTIDVKKLKDIKLE